MNISSKNNLGRFGGAVSVAALALSGALAIPATAQEVTNDNGLDVIIVTAQKRAENIQDVPISISTMDGDNLDNILSGGDDILALSGRIPSLNIESSNGRVAPRFYIRGLGNTDFDLAASQPVSVIMDDVVMENVALKSFPLFDIAQVEVLRGPQGTLFGRNTTAGIVKFDSVRPSDEFSANGSVSWGRYNTVRATGAVGGALIENKLSMRISALYTQRDNWIDNGFTNENNVLGGYEDVAGRLQLLFTPTENFSALVIAQARSLDGNSATLFRANIFDAGSNRLNNNFVRDTVFFDGGNNNAQSYDNAGLTLKMEYETDAVTFTSISSLQTVDGSSIGDIDGGFGAVFLPGGGGPGFIPFPSTTEGSIKNHNQRTQEFRVASNGSGPAKWQAGAYYFNMDLDLGTNPFFVPETVLKQSNNTWAIFGQGSYDLSDQFTVTAGVRYTEDKKRLGAIATNFPISEVNIKGSKVSWDVSGTYAASDTLNLYARAARGFRAPSIQGRDVAFFGQPSTARSETIDSIETGFKSELLENTLRLNADVYYYRIKNMQLTAIGGAGNFNQLINAKKGIGYGFESDLEWLAADNFVITAGFAYNKTEFRDPNLAVPVCGSGLCTPLDPLDANGNALVSGNPFPQAPKITGNFTARYSVPAGDNGELYAFTDWLIQGKTNFFLYESAEFKSSGNFEGGLRAGYLRHDDSLDVSFYVRNITNENNVIGGIDFNNLTGFTKGPRTFGLTVSVRR
ncbi:MAG: TonB-dependent receptor [Robiginitomaculum sp.]|nr:MAG: TonB-dependent receptor [Robiginitomaculum sp.]